MYECSSKTPNYKTHLCLNMRNSEARIFGSTTYATTPIATKKPCQIKAFANERQEV